jgi:hypothetical protein
MKLAIFWVFVLSACGDSPRDHSKQRDSIKSDSQIETAEFLSLYTMPTSGQITRIAPVAKGIFSFSATVRSDFSIHGNGQKKFLAMNANGKTDIGREINNTSGFGDPINFTGRTLDYRSANVEVTINSATKILDLQGNATTADRILRQRVNIQTTAVVAAEAVETNRDPYFYITASKIQILPADTFGACTWNTNQFFSVEGGCLDKQTGVVWNTSRRFNERNDTCNSLNNRRLGGRANWDVASEIEYRQISGILRGPAHFDAWGHELPTTSLRGEGLARAATTAARKIPSYLETVLGTEYFTRIRRTAELNSAGFATREGRGIELLSGDGFTPPPPRPPFRDVSNFIIGGTDPYSYLDAFCVSRPGGFLPPRITLTKPNFPRVPGLSFTLEDDTKMGNVDDFKRIVNVYPFRDTLLTPVGYNLADMAYEWDEKDVVFTGKLTLAGSTFMVSALFPDVETNRQGAPAVNFLFASLADGTSARRIKSPSLSLSPSIDFSKVVSLTGKPVTNLNQILGKKIQVKVRINRSNFQENAGNITPSRIKVVPITGGGCFFESDVFETVPEGCQVSGGRIFWTGIETHHSGGILAGPIAQARFLYPPAQPGFPFGEVGFSASGRKTGSVQSVVSQLLPGYSLPTAAEWISTLNALGGQSLHLFNSTFDKVSRGQGNSSRWIWLKGTDGGTVAQDSGGNVIATKPARDPKVLAGSWKTILGDFFPSFEMSSDLFPYGYPKATGKNIKLFESVPTTDVEVRSYFLLNRFFSDSTTSIDTAPRSFGLVARYKGPQAGTTNPDQNMYKGEILFNGKYFASIWKNVNGVWTKLNEREIPTPLQTAVFQAPRQINGRGIIIPVELEDKPLQAQGGLLTFTVKGKNLTLKFTDQYSLQEKVISSAVDESITGPGLTGVYLYSSQNPMPTSQTLRGGAYNLFYSKSLTP